MFTGIVEETGRVKSLTAGRLTIEAQDVLQDVKLGDSIAVNGVCLTVTEYGSDFFTADVMPETVRCTSFAQLKRGSLVNLERALLPTTRMGGHLVSGHIDGVGTIKSFTDEGNAVLMEITADSSIMNLIVVKGSVALDGISLTVAALTDDSFTVSLIPHTRQVTSLRERKKGDIINIENDVIGKYVQRFMAIRDTAQKDERITYDFLRENGF